MVHSNDDSGSAGSADPVSYGALDPRTLEALAALLAIDADTAAAVRESSPARRRPVRHYGPRLDLGYGARQPPDGDTDGSAPTSS